MIYGSQRFHILGFNYIAIVVLKEQTEQNENVYWGGGIAHTVWVFFLTIQIKRKCTN